MKTWFEPREVLFTFGELDLGFRTLVADFEFWTQVVDFGFGTLVADVKFWTQVADFEFWTQVADFGFGTLVADFGCGVLVNFYLSWIFILKLRTIFFGSCTVESHSRVMKMIVGLWPENEILPSVDFLTLQEINVLISYVLKGDMTSCIIDFKERKELFSHEHSQ